MADVHGRCDPRFERVRAAFVESFERHGEVGAACAVYCDGRSVVDLWGGLADRATGRPWAADTAAVVFSSTKGVTAIVAGMLVDGRVLDFDAPVARVWPEFAAAGKERITLRTVLSHRAGLPAVEGDFTLERALAWHPVVEALARQAPLWDPGTSHGYHARTYGWLAGEVVRRATGRTVGRFLADDIARPLGLELWVGLPEAEEGRLARIVPPSPPADPAARELMERFMGPDTLTGKVMTGPSGLFHYDEMWNTRPLHAAELPSSNGVATARALARLYAAAIGPVDGVRLLEPATLADMCRVQSDDRDRVLLLPTRFGTGFMLPPTLSIHGRDGAFGHPGAGGSLGYADPAAGLALGYVMNRMDLGLTGDPRSAGLVAAAYESLGAPG
ncbi:MAG TPA: serine hydrolase domain-containing protein [Candidatus Binatia bacterium]|nr:serine hydrolase domain-containing protein [Candidatus Binatia bacterium]